MFKKVISFFLFFIIMSCSILSAQNRDQVILPLPFKNMSGMDLDYLGEIVQNDMYAFFNNLEGYSAIYPEKIDRFMAEKNYLSSDLENRDRILEAANNFKADLIIRGNLKEEELILELNFEVIDVKSKKVIYRLGKTGTGGIDAIDTINTLAQIMVEDFTGIKMEVGQLQVVADNTCDLFIDDIKYGTTPFSQKIHCGSHQIKVVYQDIDGAHTIYQETVNIGSNVPVKIDINVFFRLKVDAEKECQVILDDRQPGKTPFNDKILTGKAYTLKLVYHNPDKNRTHIIAQKVLDKQPGEIVDLYYPVSGNLEVETGQNLISIRLNRSEYSTELYQLSLMPGSYRINLFMEDPEWKRNYCFYKNRHTIQPGKNQKLDFSSLIYKKKPALAIFPSAMQFYHKEYIKGGIILALFLTNITVAGLAPLLSWVNYNYNYIPILNSWNAAGPASGYSSGDVTSAFNSTYIILGTMLGTGITLALTAWIFSIIDGIVAMNRIYKLFNHYQKKSKINVRFVLDIR